MLEIGTQNRLKALRIFANQPRPLHPTINSINLPLSRAPADLLPAAPDGRGPEADRGVRLPARDVRQQGVRRPALAGGTLDW